ncbi:MAG TPA: hypothetical protein VMB34_20805 [Acetobacteraceae bacterium]|nr:hypothetical protein [Acetobacteraceae bacterium]
MVVIRLLDSDLYHSFERLLALVWQQTWPDELAREIVRWRYYQRPVGHMTWVACDGDQCVAMVDSRVRPYILCGQRTMIRETADWYCLPDYRHYGLGLQVLAKLRSFPEPVLVVGGTDTTRQILPLLRWTVLPPVQSYVLPVTARGLAANMMRLKWPHREALARLVWRGLPLRPPRRLRAPSGRPEMQLLHAADWYELPADTGNRFMALLERDHWQWLTKMPAAFATPLGMVFRLDGVVVGFCLAQLEPSAAGLDGRIVHLQAERNDARLLGWMVSVAARILVDRGAAFIRCFVSTPEKIEAVQAVGFVFSQTMPCHWWNRPGVPVPESIDVDYLRGDDAQPLGAIRGRYFDRRERGQAA